MGSGLVVVRGEHGDWSPPSALALASVGWGLQAGGALHDLLIVLRNKAAVQAFCGSIHCGVGGNVSLAVGPVGRQADANMRLGRSGAALGYSYSCSRGAYIGVSIEGTIITTRDKANQGFYGRTLTAKQLLLGSAVNQPPAAKILYAALQELMDRVLPVAASSGLPRTRTEVTAALTPPLQEERPGRGRTLSRNSIAPAQQVADVADEATVHSSQVMGASDVSDDGEDESGGEVDQEEGSFMAGMFAE